METVVIIGASHASVDVISTLRNKGWTGRICLVGDEQEPPYQRPPLSKGYFKDEVPAEKLWLRNDSFYADAKVDLYLGRTAEKIDRQSKEVTLDNGDVLPYSKLVLATGTRARQLPVAGADLPCIHYLRTKRDVDQIKQKISPDNTLLIVGAGYIGLEVAASAVKQGVNVIALEAMQRVLERVTGPTVSNFYQDMHAEQGVDIRLGAKLQHFEDTANGYRAIMADGEEIDFDIAIIGIGVIPNTELAESSGLACDNGIVVNEFTQTQDPDIYAIGDCSNHPNFIYDRQIRLESVPNATGQAKIAANGICGNPIIYDQLPWFWSDQYDVKLQTAGILQGYDVEVVRGEIADRKFSVFYLQNGRLIAVDAINSPADFMLGKKLISAKASPSSKQLSDTTVSLKELI